MQGGHLRASAVCHPGERESVSGLCSLCVSRPQPAAFHGSPHAGSVWIHHTPPRPLGTCRACLKDPLQKHLECGKAGSCPFSPLPRLPCGPRARALTAGCLSGELCQGGRGRGQACACCECRSINVFPGVEPPGRGFPGSYPRQ